MERDRPFNTGEALRLVGHIQKHRKVWERHWKTRIYGDREKRQDRGNNSSDDDDDDDDDNDDNDSNNSQHIKHLLPARQSFEHNYELTHSCNPHSCPVKQKLLLSHFTDEDTKSEGISDLPRVTVKKCRHREEKQRKDGWRNVEASFQPSKLHQGEMSSSSVIRVGPRFSDKSPHKRKTERRV
uniref:Uncharacterized protein n=1 Tax=Rousettus aegyptiacus TaxID=9407 RepID=A0A7J8CIA9_ROUAE|nr:hypothetical protein HJG63_009117 [Rousettus aegyptiacus]